MAVLNRYKGVWGKKQVIHLLKRTMFGAKWTDVNYFLNKDMESSVDELLTMSNPPNPPLNYYEGQIINGQVFSDADGVALGQTWVHEGYGDGTTNFMRGESLRAWWMSNLLNQNRSIEEKMILFWHAHFCTEIRAGGGATAAYSLTELFRIFAMGPLQNLMIEVSKNPYMTFYLNGYLNTKFSPDENYARELMELFGVGKGPDSHFSEEDVREAARVLTGHSLSWANQTYNFVSNNHDTNKKEFSSFFGNKVINGKTGNAGADELTELVDMILENDECAKFIVRKLYRFFVNYDITPAVELDIIVPLANLYRSNGYYISAVLEELLKSEHFYQQEYIGAMIKSPLDFVVGMVRECDVKLPDLQADVYKYYLELRYHFYEVAMTMQMALGDPPNVSGWPAYYQNPAYYELWINSDTLPKRNKYAKNMLNSGYLSNIDHIRFAEQFSSVSNPSMFLDDILSVFYQIDISQETKDKIKQDALLSGQTSDVYWSSAWQDYLNNPSDVVKANIVRVRLKNLLELLMQSSEYQLC